MGRATGPLSPALIMRALIVLLVHGWAWVNLLTLVLFLPICIVAFPIYKAGADVQTALAIASLAVGGAHLWRKL